jgi:hypothetical protein
MNFFQPFTPLRLAANPGDKKSTTQKLSTVLGGFSKLFMFCANGFQGCPHALNRCKLLIALNKNQLSTAHPLPLTTTTIFK